jgi:GntR family transcriptional regulator/MocR family aminotransferase
MKPGYHEIYTRYRDNITRGVLKPGDKVPAIRVLAEELKVARKTVETAYAILTGEGYLVSQGARGTRVNPDLLLPVRNVPAEQATGTLPASLISQRERAGFLRPGSRLSTVFPIKNGCCFQARQRALCARRRCSTRRCWAGIRCARPSPAI